MAGTGAAFAAGVEGVVLGVLAGAGAELLLLDEEPHAPSTSRLAVSTPANPRRRCAGPLQARAELLSVTATQHTR